MSIEYNSRCMCMFCKLNKRVTNKINWIIVKETRPYKPDMRRQAAIIRQHEKIRKELRSYQRSGR